MIATWFLGLVRTRNGRLAGSIAGVAITVAMLAALGAFLTQSTASMTRRAIAGVPVDWQVELVPGSTVRSAEAAIRRAGLVTALQRVGYASVDGFEARTGSTVQTTSKGKVLGLEAGYMHDFPRQVRPLVGSLDGALVAQQTAANLHVTVGDSVTIHRVGLPSAQVRVDGVVDLPNADSMFQAVGVPPGVAPQAPPDNVLLLPAAEWHRLFDPQAAARPDTVRTQLHVGLAHDTLPADPVRALAKVQGAAKNVELRIAGSGIVADNLAARLDAARADALYARVLFLFLGAPGVALATLLTVAVVASGGARRRRDQALLRMRGASRAQIVKFAASEAVLVGAGGTAAGLALAEGLSRALLGGGIFAPSTLYPVVASAFTGMIVAVAAMIVTAWIDARQTTVVMARTAVGSERPGLWRRAGLDFILIALAAVVFWKTWSSGYQVVLAPEGTPAASVDYTAFLAPVLLWLGIGLLTVRLCLGGLRHGRRVLAIGLRPIAGSLAGVAAAAMARQPKRLTRGVGLVGLAFAFATSTAVFNTTYESQARVDAALTNGADVTVTGTAQAPASARLQELEALPGVAAAQPMQHRLAYVGTDLQDLYGIDPAHIGLATRMSNAFFGNNDARKTLALLARTPDGVLVSEETVKTFQLNPGDTLNLRLQSATDHQYHVVPFRFVGVVREFPTAPRDSFLVANADYVGRHTAASASEVVLLRTTGDPARLAAAARPVVATLPGARVTEIGAVQRQIASSLTAVDLDGMTKLELGLAVLMVAGAAGLVLALGIADRRRTFAILSALGAKPAQLGAFLWSEAWLLYLGGAVVGTATGFALAWMLVKLLTGAFDPPPEALAVPWPYLAAVAGVALVSVALAVVGALRETRVPAVQRMREI